MSNSIGTVATGVGFGTVGSRKNSGSAREPWKPTKEHIKLGYPDAQALHQGAREWFELNRR